MAGHSKWANIKHRKGRQDAIRGKLYTKLGREIIVAAKLGGGDPGMNVRLRLAIERAKAESLPKENIERAIKRGTGEIEGENFEEITYEGLGPGGVGIMIDVYSENRNRTVADLRHTLTRNGGSLTDSGSVSWQFKPVGQIIVERVSDSEHDEQLVTMAALDAGAEDVIVEDEFYIVQTAVEDLHKCAAIMEQAGVEVKEVSLTRIATNMAELTEAELKSLVRLLDALEELDDVKETQINVDIPDGILQEA